MKIAIIGSRTFSDYNKLKETIYKYFSHIGESHHENRILHFTEIISGGAGGADKNAERFSKEHNIPIIIIRPDYNTYGKQAPLIRNEEIVKGADCIICFWDKESRGSRNALNHAKNHNKDTIIIYI